MESASCDAFENVQPDSNDPATGHYNKATGEIREEVAPRNDSANVVEGGNEIQNGSDFPNLLANDETGVNGKITSFTYTDESGATQTAALVNGEATVDTRYGTVTIHEDGTWSFTSDPTEHNSPDPVEDLITYTVTDDDGKTGSATFTVSVTDTDPSAKAPDSIVDEDDLPNGSDSDKEPLTVTENFQTTKGADDIADVRFDDATLTTLTNQGLKSGGTALSYALSNDGHTLTATADGETIFTIDILNPDDAAGTQQQYRFTLSGPLDHPAGDGENRIDLPFDYTVADTDSQVAGSQFKVTVVDDVPTANSEAVLSVVEGNVALTGMIDLLANDVTGADIPLTLQGFEYQDENGDWQPGTFGVAEDTLYGTLTVDSDGSWSYISDATEHNESGTDAQDTDDWVTDTFRYTVVDYDGDTSTATQDIRVTDGADPQIAPTDGVVDEADLGLGNSFTPTSITNSLGVSKGSDDIAETKLDIDSTKNALEALNLTSNGSALSYDVSDHGVTATDADGNTVFTLTLNNPTDGSGNSQSYTFTLDRPLDHVDNGQNDDNDVGHDPMYLPFSVYTYDTDNANGIDGDDDASGSFTVQVLDSVPTGTDQTVETWEDSSVTFRLSIDDFQGPITITPTNGTAVSLASGDETDLYDASGNDVIGVLRNNGDGTVTFTPSPDYSNYHSDPASLPSFQYAITDSDGDEAQATVVLRVDPRADAPHVTASDVQTLEDADASNSVGNQREGDNDVSLNLTLPEKSGDRTDQNGSDPGDRPERLGYITLDFANTSEVSGAIVKAGGETFIVGRDGSSIQVYITDETDYHHKGLDPDNDSNPYGVIWKLSRADYESMRIVPAEDNDRDIRIDISVTSYEVDDADRPLSTTDPRYFETDSDSMRVEIKAQTDDVALKWDDASRGTISTTDHSDDTYTFDGFSEGDSGLTIDLTALLTEISGAQKGPGGAHGDLDGSEHRSYTITGIPDGTLVTLGGVTVAASGGSGPNTADASVTIDFPDNTDADPAFSMTLPEQYSGSIEHGVITLNVADHDSDTSYVDVSKSAKVYFSVTVDPVADDCTLQVAQPIGDEDAGRSMGNTANDASASAIDVPENAIDLFIQASSDDDDGSETYTITVDSIPDGASLYYDGTLFDPANPPAAGSGLTVTDNGDGSWKVEIEDFDNDAPLKNVPPHNSDEDFTLHIEGISVEHNPDGTVATDSNGDIIQQLSPTTLDINVQVRGVADIPVHDELATVTVDDDSGTAETFNATGVKDQGGYDLSTILATPDQLDSYDGDGSETLTIKLTHLPEDFDISGATMVGGSGSDRIWFIDLTSLKNGDVRLVTPENYAGEVDFDIAMITTEREGDSKTHPFKPVSVMITPEVDGELNTHDSQEEDQTKTLDFSLITPDQDAPGAGAESLHSLAIRLDSIPDGVTLTADGQALSDRGDGYADIPVHDGTPATVQAILPEDSHMDGQYSFLFSYEIADTAVDAAENTYTSIKTVTDTTYTVDVQAVTDDIDMTTTTDATGSVTAGSGDAAPVTVDGTGTFTKHITITGIDSDGRGHPDEDGSEKFTRIEIFGLPQGISVEGGVYAGDTGGGNYSGHWLVDIPDVTLDGNAGYDLVFRVDQDMQEGEYDVRIVSYNEDAGNGQEQSDSETFSGSSCPTTWTAAIPLRLRRRSMPSTRTSTTTGPTITPIP